MGTDQAPDVFRLVPLRNAMRDPMARRGLTQRGLGALIGKSGTQVGEILRGNEFPSPAITELICAALGLDLTTIAEYQLVEARRRLNWREVGFEAAVATLQRSGLVATSLAAEQADAEATPSLDPAEGPSDQGHAAPESQTTERTNGRKNRRVRDRRSGNA